jgi:hypothetical protein
VYLYIGKIKLLSGLGPPGSAGSQQAAHVGAIKLPTQDENLVINLLYGSNAGTPAATSGVDPVPGVGEIADLLPDNELLVWGQASGLICLYLLPANVGPGSASSGKGEPGQPDEESYCDDDPAGYCGDAHGDLLLSNITLGHGPKRLLHGLFFNFLELFRPSKISITLHTHWTHDADTQ